MYDVIIIGAGPAGTAAAYDLVCAGYSVLILDRRSFPRKKACAGGITPKALNLYPYDISHLVLRVCRQVKVIRPGGASFFVSHQDPICYMVQRKDLDGFALKKAMAAGAEFETPDRIISLDPIASKRCHSGTNGSAIRILMRKGQGELSCEARFVIGADGANSLVRRLLEKSAGPTLKRPFAVTRCPALEADVKVADPSTVPMTFDFSKGIPGYYWLFPRHDHVNIGIFSTQYHTAMDQVHLADYAAQHLGCSDLCAIKGYPIATDGRAVLPGAGHVLLAGDAGGFAEPLLGEGIYAALTTGHLAAAAIDRAITSRSSDALTLYHHSLARVYMDLRLYRWAAKILYRFPGPSLGLASSPLLHGPFVRGYASGRSLFQTIFPF